jgi:hypothetical protein
MFREGMSLNIRAEFNNIFNRTFLTTPARANSATPIGTNAATGVITSGYGYINLVPGALGYAPAPRTGQIVARFQF